jgi:hypothetical protein
VSHCKTIPLSGYADRLGGRGGYRRRASRPGRPDEHPVSYRDVETGGAARAARLIAELV